MYHTLPYHYSLTRSEIYYIDEQKIGNLPYRRLNQLERHLCGDIFLWRSISISL